MTKTKAMPPKRKNKKSDVGRKLEKPAKKARVSKATISQPEKPVITNDISPRSVSSPLQSAKYPKHLKADLKQLKTASLKRYTQLYDVEARQDTPHSELASIVARHFDLYLDVDEEDVIATFCKKVRSGDDWKDFGFDALSLKRATRESTKRKKKNSRKRQEMLEESREGHVVQEEEDDVKLYCLCNKPSYGEMIACDNKKCPQPSQWYHYECVGLYPSSHPEEWYCPHCNNDSSSDEMADGKSRKRGKSLGVKK